MTATDPRPLVFTPGTHDDGLVNALRQAADGLVRHNIRDLENVLTQIVASAAQTVPDADGGGISRSEEGTVHACHATDPGIRDLDQLRKWFHPWRQVS